jgi:hypothetical protein
MRKRQSIVAVVTRIVMQISAKLLGPLWHVNFDTVATPMMRHPCMLVGIDTCQNKETRRPVLGFVALSVVFFVSADPEDRPAGLFMRLLVAAPAIGVVLISRALERWVRRVLGRPADVAD